MLAHFKPLAFLDIRTSLVLIIKAEIKVNYYFYKPVNHIVMVKGYDMADRVFSGFILVTRGYLFPVYEWQETINKVSIGNPN